MNKILKLTGMLALGFTLVIPTVMTSCGKEEYDTQQYKGGVNLNVWGPRPVARGGELRFLGSGMNQITSIAIPGSGEVTDIKVISNEEIRITVPLDAEPGKVTLTYSGGKIESLTELSFLEPISLDEMAPSLVKPGQTLTLKGDYLNLISEVILPENVVISEEDFATHNRQEISFVVPEQAKSGQVIISDGGQPLPNWIYSEEEITIVLPSVEKVADLTGMKPGETVSVTVKDIDLVKSVEMPNGDAVDFVVEESKLSFVLPENVSNGTVVMIPASGVKVAVATIGVALPEEVVADPASSIWKGDIVKFKGVNMELVTGVSFPNVADVVIPDSKTATEVTVTVPEGTQSGSAVLHTASGGSVEVAVSTVKPENVSYNPNPASLASKVNVAGKNLQNVASITFGGSVTVEVSSPAANGFEVEIPATLSDGSNTVLLTLTNGEQVECESISLTAPVCAYATVLPGEDAEINAGTTIALTIANADKLTGVKVNGQDVQYILNGDNLIVQIPSSAGKNTVVTLVSSNGEISYNIAVIPATHQERVLYDGPMINLDWSGDEGVNKFRINKDKFEGVPVGGKVVFHVTPSAGAQIQLSDANWGQIVILEPQQGETTIALELTADIRDRIMNTNDGWSDTALIIQGANCVVSKVTGEWELSLETTIWEGSWTNENWGGNQDLAWGGYDWSAVKPGAKLRLYMTPTVADGEWGCVSLRHGDGWGNLPDPIPSQYDNPSNPLEVELTANVIDDLVANGGLVISGSTFTLNKVTIE